MKSPETTEKIYWEIGDFGAPGGIDPGSVPTLCG